MQIHTNRRRDGNSERPLGVRVTRYAARFLVSLLHGICLAATAVPPLLVAAAAAPALGQSSGSAPDTTALQSAFAAAAEPLGLQVFGEPQVEGIGTNLSTATITAAVPIDRRTTSTIFLRRTSVIATLADQTDQIVSETDLRIRYEGIHVTLEYVDRFLPALDLFAGHTTGLAGEEIRRTAEFDSAGLEAYVAAHVAEQRSLLPNARRVLSPSALASEIEASNYVETATVVLPDGTTRTYPAGQLDPSAVLSGTGAGADLTVGCLATCFNDAGGAIGLTAALCLIAGLVVCAAACALTEGIACLPCIGGAGNVCGVAIAVGSLAVCIARCINPNYNPPPPTPKPTPKPTPTPTPRPCTGDCDRNGEVTVAELVKGVSIALGISTPDKCQAFDCNANGQVTVDCLLQAVNHALNGCKAP